MDVGFGLLTIAGTAGLGFLPGVGLIGIGIDNIITGFQNIRYGRIGHGHSAFKVEFIGQLAHILRPHLFLRLHRWGCRCRYSLEEQEQ
jgi:hypothetical protein